ncbi:MAG TPA: FtsX-like permease family protein [Bdellovibrionota bacterium]|jgi:lipoprotein-releasing system permease protein
MSSIVSTVARRFLTGKKHNAFLSFIALVSLLGVCLGVAALTVVMGVMEGFETQLRSIITGTHSHIVLYSARQMIPNELEIEDRLRALAPNEIQALGPYIFSEVMLAKGPRVVGSVVEGIEKESAQKTTEIEKHLTQGGFPTKGTKENLPTIVLGGNLAESLGAKLDDEVNVISPFFDKESLQPRSRKFKVGGIVSTGMYEYDSKYSHMDADEARDFFRIPPATVSAIKIKTNDPQKSYELAQRIQKELQYPYRARDWTELNRNLLYAVRLQKAVIFIILTAIILVAAFNIMSTLMMMMSEKKKEMSILKAMGLSARKSSGIFMRVGLLIGVSGAVAGITTGLAICLLLGKTRFVKLPADVYFISYLPVDVRPATLFVIAACALVVALLATLYPAYRIAVESPVEGLRYE